MYGVSNEYINKITSVGVKKRRITGSIGGVSFGSSDILKDSVAYQNQMAKNSDITLGGVFIGTLNLTFIRSFSDRIARGSWRGKEVQISIDLNTEGDTWEPVPLGVFTVDEAEHSREGVKITAYDRMALFDKNLYINTAEGYPFDFLSAASRACGVPLAQTRAEIEALPNGDQLLGIYPENDLSTYRDLISVTAAALGSFATVNRAGRLEIRTFKTAADITIDKYNRAAGGSWSDFKTYYTGVSITDIETEEAKYYGRGSGDTGLTMKLGTNPLLQYGTEEIKTARAMNIVEALESFNYTPFKASGFLDPAFDLGDVINFTEGLAGTSSKSMIMKISMQFNRGTKLEGFGKNPAQQSAQSKTDKNIAGLMSKQKSEADKITIISQANLADVEIDARWHKLVHMRIGVMQSQIIQLNGVVGVELTEAGTVWVRYRLNSDYLLFKHVCQFPTGPDTITLFIPLAISNETINDILVEIQSPDARGTIAAENAKITLQGVGVISGDWDGYIECADEYSFNLQSGLGFAYEERTPTIETRQPMPLAARDAGAFTLENGLGFAYAENARLTLDNVSYRISTEDGAAVIRTEDGLKTIKTEE